MSRWIWNAGLMASVLCAQLASPRECSAGPLKDWLSGRAPYYQPQPWHIDRRSPRTLSPNPAYASQPAATYPTGVIYQQPTAIETAPGFQTAPLTQQTPAFQQAPMAQPAMVMPQAICPPGPVSNAGCGRCGLTRACGAPRTSYRSTWVRVPVTRYRPVVGPAQTAYGVPATQPCNGYTWQLRRVPVTTWRPLAGMWNSLFPPRQPVSYFGTQVDAPCITDGTAIPPAASDATPYYPNYPTQPGAIPGTTSVVPSAGLGTVPFQSSPTSPPPNSGNIPADRRPSLNPNGIAPNGARSQMVPLPPDSPPAAENELDLQPLSPDHRAIEVPETPNSEPPPSESRPSSNLPSTDQGRFDNYFNVQPVRDPEFEAGSPATDTVPQLLGPNNHSAANERADQGHAWQVVPIKWETADHPNAGPSPAAPHPAPSPSPAPRSPRQNFDESGWQSAR